MQKHVNLVDLVKSFPTSYSNEYLLAKCGFDTAENEPRQVCGTGKAREGSLGSLASLASAEQTTETSERMRNRGGLGVSEEAGGSYMYAYEKKGSNF